MTKKSAMPVSKAKTAYSLLTEIRRLILENPKRYDQTDVLRRRRMIPREYTRDEDWPACGTVGCVAGWTVALRASRIPNEHILERAGRILGLTEKQQMRLFRGYAAGQRFGNITAHARRGAAHIARFQDKYAAQLKAKKL